MHLFRHNFFDVAVSLVKRSHDLFIRFFGLFEELDINPHTNQHTSCPVRRWKAKSYSLSSRLSATFSSRAWSAVSMFKS